MALRRTLYALDTPIPATTDMLLAVSLIAISTSNELPDNSSISITISRINFIYSLYKFLTAKVLSSSQNPYFLILRLFYMLCFIH
jgi:hypothetical protein